jgi:hypothetical protein
MLVFGIKIQLIAAGRINLNLWCKIIIIMHLINVREVGSWPSQEYSKVLNI